jgi:hypothetical protein
MYIDSKRAVTIGGFRQADGSRELFFHLLPLSFTGRNAWLHWIISDSSEQISIHFSYRDMSLFNPREPM